MITSPLDLALVSAPGCQVIHGDSREHLVPLAQQVDLLMMSPPYADARRKHYASVKPDDYADWFASFHEVFWQALKPQGSLIINLKDRAVNGVRHRYVWHTIERFTRLGWYCIDDYIWVKTTSFPGYWPNRLRNSWEFCFHLSKTLKPAMYQEAVKVPIATETKRRLSRTPAHAKAHYSSTGSGFWQNGLASQGKDQVLPSNVLQLAPESRNRGHPAVYPLALPTFFIKLFSKAGDLVVDPFAGSGTTGVAALALGRRCVLIDSLYDYCIIAAKRLQQAALNKKII